MACLFAPPLQLWTSVGLWEMNEDCKALWGLKASNMCSMKSITISQRSQTPSPPTSRWGPVTGFIWPLVRQPCFILKSCQFLVSLPIPMPFTLLSILEKRNISLYPCLYQNWGHKKVNSMTLIDILKGGSSYYSYVFIMKITRMTHSCELLAIRVI